jgi:hypothetical protein
MPKISPPGLFDLESEIYDQIFCSLHPDKDEEYNDLIKEGHEQLKHLGFTALKTVLTIILIKRRWPLPNIAHIVSRPRCYQWPTMNVLL